LFYREWLPKTARPLGRRLNPQGRIRRLLYVAGASDVAGALTMLEGPAGGLSEMVVVDVLPFGKPFEVAVLHADESVKQAYMGTGGVSVHEGSFLDLWSFLTEVKLTGPAILWELEHLGARNVRVQYLDAHGRPRHPGTRPRLPGVQTWDFWSADADDPAPFYHPDDRDVVRVRFSLGGKRRSILYVQQDVLEGAKLAPVLSRTLRRGIDAYLEKAPLALTRQERYHVLRDRALRRLSPHGLVLSDHPQTPARAQELFPQRQRQVLRPDGPIGYNAQLNVQAATMLEGALPARD
jgi:hypothetical protein